MTLKRPNGTSLLVQMGVIIALGFAIGLADAFVARPVDLKPREAPPSVAEVIARSPANRAASTTQTTPTDPDRNTVQPEATPVSPAQTPTPTPTSPSAFTYTPKAAMPPGHVTIDEARQLLDAGAIFIDSRKLESYAEGHVTDAFRLESSMFKTGDPPELGLMPRDGIIVVYCNGGNCDESDNVAKLLTGSGYKAVYVMHDGFPGWKAAGHPSATGE